VSKLIINTRVTKHRITNSFQHIEEDTEGVAERKRKSLRRLTKSNPQHLPHHHQQNRAGSGSSLSSRCESRTLANAPADPETIATRNTRAKSKRIDVAKNVNKYDVDTTVYSKSKRIAPRVTI
jgi:hypothetical protein